MDFIPNFGVRYVLGDLEAEVELDDRGPLVFNSRLSPWDLQDRKFVKLFRLSKPLARELWQELEPRLPAVNRASAIPSDIRSWTDLKMITKKKAATMKKQGAKTGGGPISSSDSEEEFMSPELPQLPREDSQGGFPASAGPSSCTATGGSGLQVVHERILSIIGKTAVEGIRGIKELGIEQCLDSDSDETPDEPLPKRPNLGADPKIPSKQVTERVASKKQLAAQWLENSRRKVEATEKVADALNNIANQIARIAESFELYNSQVNESI